MIPPSENTWERWLYDIDKALVSIRAAGPEMINVARMSSAPDGFGAGGGGDHRSSGPANPTEAHGIRSLPTCSSVRDNEKCDHHQDRHTPRCDFPGCTCLGFKGAEVDDRIQEALEDAFALIRCMVSDAKLAARRVTLFNNRGDLRTNPSAADHCLACGRVVTGATNDKLKGGHCPACYTDHQRWKRVASDPTALPMFRWKRWTKACQDLGQEPSQSEWKAWQDGTTGPPKLTRKREKV